MPWSGRAKIHASHFSELNIDRLDKIEVLTQDGTCLSLIAFADSHVPLDQIRICAEDIIKLGISEDDQVIVRKMDPISD
ncbi:MAG: hypothetical protein GXY18_08985 [Methanomicrobiales archaeon]|nr:hypothetical protein [Methanomicrobiales archaeon]